MKRSKKLNHNSNQESFDYFFEEVDYGSNGGIDYQENLDAGLSQENVYKLTEDMFNPLPADTES